MPTDTTYNGWTNYETWNVNLWLSNDEGTYREVVALVEAAKAESEPDGGWDGGPGIDGRDLRGVVADRIRAYVEELPEYVEVAEKASFASDLLRGALSEVDWLEIADGWLED